MKIAITVILTIVSVILFTKWINYESDDKPQYITFSAEKLKEVLEILDEKNVKEFKISAVLSANDSNGQSIKFDLSTPALSSRDLSNIEDPETSGIRNPGIKDKFLMEARTHFRGNQCVYETDIYIHPNVPIPSSGRCKPNQWGMYGGFSVNGDWVPYHCHCFDPWF